jgi:hypothetical protein
MLSNTLLFKTTGCIFDIVATISTGFKPIKTSKFLEWYNPRFTDMGIESVGAFRLMSADIKSLISAHDGVDVPVTINCATAQFHMSRRWRGVPAVAKRHGDLIMVRIGDDPNYEIVWE